MNYENESFKIFSLLDDKKQGFINTNEFLDKLIKCVPDNDEIEEKDLLQIKHILKPYLKIGPEEFKNIYFEIKKLKEDNDSGSWDNRGSEVFQSSDSSDVDEILEKKHRYCKEGIGSDNHNEVLKQEMFLTSPSATKNAKDLINNSRASYEKILSSDLLNDSIHFNLEDDTNYAQETKFIHDSNRLLKEEITDLKIQLKEQENRYQTEKDQNKELMAKMCLLESINHELDIKYIKEIKKITSESKTKVDSLNATIKESEEEFKTRYEKIQKQFCSAQIEKENLQLHCDQLINENNILSKENQNLVAQCLDNQRLMMEYKRVMNKQVTELQTERDQLEMMNKKLSAELQAFKHLPANEKSNDQEVIRRPRTRSEFGMPEKLKRHSSEIVKKDSHVNRYSTITIESESNRVVHSLTMENRNLVERIAHLETVGFYQRQKLEAVNCLSIADELEQFDMKELQKALAIERETAKALQNYMELLTHKLLLAGYIDVFQQP